MSEKEVLIVLGAPNSDSGVLSPMAISRLNLCKKHYTLGKLILCTGGWGPHFNKTPNSHASYARNYLIKNGVSKFDFLQDALSSNTVDDAMKIKSILAPLKNIKLSIITSDYHRPRVEIIFNEILAGYSMEFFEVISDLDKKKYDQLVQHETQAINAIKKNGLYY
jgi:uncharacterized SAM-binding protein YcdF (DUF218 family)